MNALNRLLFTKTDIAPLAIFRVLFGFLVAAECFGAILTGWVKKTLIEPRYTFNFIGFDWIQPLSGMGMYGYFAVMGLLGLAILLGFKYRFSIIAFTLLWTGVYLMQKTSYNNHYYLLILISGMMCFFPADAYFSVDARTNPSIRREWMYGYVKWMVVVQLFLVYTFASVAKLYGDWLNFGVIKMLMLDKADYFLIGPLLQKPAIHALIGVFGIVFDLLVVPALLYRHTRKWAFIAAIFFHLFNSVVFQIGIFPYLALAFSVFFFEPQTLCPLFLKGKLPFIAPKATVPQFKKPLLALASIYFLLQLILPLRHHFIKDDVLWTEEGHRMAWRMMLRTRSGTIAFKVTDKNSGESKVIDLNQYLTPKQKDRVACYPDFIWQFAQKLKKEHADKGQAVSVYALNSKVSINGKSYRAFIDPNVDLANEPWNHFKHHEWIFPSTGQK